MPDTTEIPVISGNVMTRAIGHLSEIAAIITEGSQQVIIMPENEAALALRFSIHVFEEMEHQRTRLGIYVRDGIVSVELLFRESDRRTGYMCLYSLIQSITDGMADTYLRNGSFEVIVRQFPELAETLEYLKVNGTIADEVDMQLLQTKLVGYYLSLSDKSSIPDPTLVLNSLAY